MNSTKINLRLIEKITVQVSNTASISKNILFMFLSFLKIWSFNLCLKLLSEFVNFSSVGKLFHTIDVLYDKFFWPEHVFLKACFSFKTEDFDQKIYLILTRLSIYISRKYRGQDSIKNLKVLEEKHWLNLPETGKQLISSTSFIPMWLP